jgi:hypothetical protein
MHTLNFKHHRAIGMLTLGFNADDIASQCEINRTTLWRWKKHPVFAKVLREKINELANAVKTQIQEIARESIEAVLDGVRELRCLVLRPYTTPHVKRMAANCLIKSGDRWLNILGYTAKSATNAELLANEQLAKADPVLVEDTPEEFENNSDEAGGEVPPIAASTQ